MTRIIILLCSLLFSCFTFGFAEAIEKEIYIGDHVDSAYITQKASNSKNEINKPVLLRLSNSHFDPLKMIPEPIAGLNTIQAIEPSKVGYYIIQFDGPIENSWKNRIKGRNVDIFDYIPDFAFIVRMNSNLEQAVRNDPHVRWLGIYQPSYKVSQGALDKMYDSDDTQESEQSFSLLKVMVFPGEDVNRLKSEIAELGGNVINEVSTKWKTSLKVNIPSESISSLAEISGVKWIEPVPEWKLHNNISTDIMAIRTPRDTYGFYGEGQTVAVCDTGLDQGSTLPASLHDDFEDGSGTSRVLQIFDRVGDGANDINSGHGTHVSGSILGNGINSGSDPSANFFPSTSFAGTAPKANLIVQAVENNTEGTLSGLPLDLNTLFDQADTAGANLHTNSWGASAGSTYTANSEEVDQYVWDHKDFLILFSAGNEGGDLDGDGVIDLFSIGSPATAKNCLTVGASEGNRLTGAGYDFNWGQGWYEFSADPIYSDHISDNPDGLAAFSSRGPVLDGRYKPDIVAPGTNILSTKSSVNLGFGWGAYNSYYMYMGGTSMSTPLTAGTASLVREYLMDIIGFTNPSAALIKAALINSAEDISPGQYGLGVYQEIPDSPVPNNVEGWGRLNLANGAYPVPPFNILYYDDAAGLNTDDYQEYTINVTDSGSPFKVNLVWTDYPGTATAQGGLVNDLDLQVTDTSSAVHYPDGALKKSSISTLVYDDDVPNVYYFAKKLAIRFTPSSYPAYVESTSFFFYNPNYSTTDVNIVVYDDDGPVGKPGGTVLFSKTLTYIPTGWITVNISGVVINSGEFFIAIEKDNTSHGLLQDDTGDGRSYYSTGSAWFLDTAYTSYIRANIRGADYSTSFDRVNNVVGLALNSATTGAYTVKVSGYNVPQGPQPYAIVISGNVSNQECTPNDTELCNTGLSGVCADGTRTCDAKGFWGGCVQDVQATAEICDGLDNDCDGTDDNGFNINTACDGIGECGAGLIECATTTTTRCSTDPGGSQDQSTEETCDSLDNDCDISIDEDFTDLGDLCTDGVGECQASGNMVCKTDGSGTECNAIPGTPTLEICDDLDNNCDTHTDDGCDDDNDGYCDNAMTVSSAPVPVCLFSPNGPGNDCDDSDSNLNPGGKEVRIDITTPLYYWIYEFQNAYNEARDGETIQSKVATYTGDLNINNGSDKSVIFKVGYDCAYTTNTGVTTIVGNVNISKGEVTIQSGTLKIQ